MPHNDPSQQSAYIGRFAPSPSGPLHFGSLVCALASYLDAKQHDGKWLVRMEDIDPPREQPGATTAILETLQAHGLHWDGEVMYQSHRSKAYVQSLLHLKQRNMTYRCSCIRKRLRALDGPYDKHCEKHPPSESEAAAIRLSTSTAVNSRVHFHDRVQGTQKEDLRASGDFIIHRKDGLFAYQLAVVVDDIEQGITDVVRGVDLLSSTARQMYVFDALGALSPRYAHIPVVLDQRGDKLSKQTFAPAIDNASAVQNLINALNFLNMPQPSNGKGLSPSELLSRCVPHWQLSKLRL